MWLLTACTGDDDRHSAETGSAPTETATVPTEPVDRIGRFRAELEADGFLLGDGIAEELDPRGCCLWESCYLFDPDADYVAWSLPPAPDPVAVDPAATLGGRSVAWRLRADEAVVAVGRTPPRAAYFGFRSYLHDRLDPVTLVRRWQFSALGDPLNASTIGTGRGGPFDADVVVVTTAHAGTEARIRAAAERAGLPAGLVNTDVVGGTDLRLGLRSESDAFRMQLSIAGWDDPDLGAAWVADPPLTVWRVTPALEGPPEPLPLPPARVAGSGTDERAWADAFEELQDAIVAAFPDYEARALPADTAACPSGCNRDVFFAAAADFQLPTWADAFVVVYGVNHERTGKASYSTFATTGVDHLSASASVDSRRMPGSAAVYLPAHPQRDDLYAWRIARSCAAADPYCIDVPPICPGWPSSAEGSIAFRAYAEAVTGTGPSPDELLVDRAILFVRPGISIP